MEPKIKREKRIKRHKKVRAKIKGTTECPRLYVFRSRKHIYAQLIDDEKGKTLVAASNFEIKKSKIKKPKVKTQATTKKTKALKEKEEITRTGKVAIAYEVGKLIAEKALKKKIKKVVFDRGGYVFHGRVKSLAEGAREGGLIF